ncbi:hypothetical protein IIA16_06480 [bacterium]|nr:hypothetical protein [bacterium]
MEKMGYSDKTKFRRKYIKPMLEAGLLAMTIPDKPKSRLQEYKTTQKGLLALEEAPEHPNGEPTPPVEDPPPSNTNQD